MLPTCHTMNTFLDCFDKLKFFLCKWQHCCRCRSLTKAQLLQRHAVLPDWDVTWLKGLTVCRYRPGSDDIRGPALARIRGVFQLRLLSSRSAGQTLPASRWTHLLLPLLLARGGPRQLRLLRFCPAEQTSVTQEHSKPAAHFHTTATGGNQRQRS